MTKEEAKPGVMVKLVGSRRSSAYKRVHFGKVAFVDKVLDDKAYLPVSLRPRLGEGSSGASSWYWDFDELELVTMNLSWTAMTWPTPQAAVVVPSCEHDFITSFQTGKPWCRKCGETSA